MVQPYGLLLAMYIGLLYLEPHTSAMVIICGIGVIILLAGGMRLWYFAPILGLGAGAVAVFYVAFPHVRTRFEVWLNPFSDMADKGLQGSMSQIAIGSGGLLGRGLGNGLQKQLYLPEPHNDFIFATWCEEMGLIGALLVIRCSRTSFTADSAWRAMHRINSAVFWRPASPPSWLSRR